MEPGEHAMTYCLGRRTHLNLGLLFSLPPSFSFFYESLISLQLYPNVSQISQENNEMFTYYILNP